MRMKALPELTPELAHPIPQGMVIMIHHTVLTVQEILFQGHEAPPREGRIMRGVEGAPWYMKILVVMAPTVQDILQELMDLNMRPMKDGTTATWIIHLGIVAIDITAGGDW